MRKNVRLMVLMLSILCFVFGLGNVIYAQAPGVNQVGGFESTLPSFWTIGNQPTGDTLSWATDQSRNMGHSLKIVKTTTSDSAAWVSDNMCSIWSPQVSNNVDILLGAYVKTSGVNTNPISFDQMWYVSYTFYDSAGALMGSTVLPINQSVASSSGFVADTNAVGQTVLNKLAWKLIVTFVAGKNATGTVWAGDFIFTGRAGAWAGQDWNTGVGAPTGWYYWLPPIGGNDGVLQNGFENTVITSEASHSGSNSLKFVLPANRAVHDGFFGTLRYPLDASVTPGSALKFNVWIKASNLVPDSAALYPVTWAVGLTPLYFAGNTDNFGYNPLKAVDYQFVFPNTTSFDWTQFSLTDTVPNDPTAKFIEVRIHIYSQMVGTLYFDDLTVSTVTGITDKANLNPNNFALNQNYPNPFNPSTLISYNIPKSSVVTVKIYDLLGNEIKTLVSSSQNAGVHQAVWNGDNNLGKKVSSGTYIYTLNANDNFMAKKMILLK